MSVQDKQQAQIRINELEVLINNYTEQIQNPAVDAITKESAKFLLPLTISRHNEAVARLDRLNGNCFITAKYFFIKF